MIRILVKDDDGSERYLVTTKPLKLTSMKERAATWSAGDQHLDRCLNVLEQMGVEARVEPAAVNGHGA